MATAQRDGKGSLPGLDFRPDLGGARQTAEILAKKFICLAPEICRTWYDRRALNPILASTLAEKCHFEGRPRRRRPIQMDRRAPPGGKIAGASVSWEDTEQSPPHCPTGTLQIFRPPPAGKWAR